MADGSANAESATHRHAADAIAQLALAAMSRHGVPPNPRNYALWYVHCGARRPDLSQAIDRLVASGQPFTPSTNQDLYVRFLAGQSDAEKLEDANERLHGSLVQVLGSLDQSHTATREYGRALDDCSDRLEDVDGIELQATVARLQRETRLMSEQTRALEEQLDRSRGEVRELRENLVSLEHEALTDDLTGISNRKAFELRLRHAAAAALENGEALSLLMLDIDHFKQFNDTHGHQTGDQVLRLVAQTLTESVKGRDTAARFGGEEFAIILPRTPLVGAVAVAEEIRRLVMRRRIVRKSRGDVLGTITLSTGASLYRLGEPIDETVRRADQALYLAKASGRNCVRDETALTAQPAAASGG